MVQHSQALIREVTRQSPFDTTCSLVANASTHYSLENQRIVVTRASVMNLGKESFSENILFKDLETSIRNMVWTATETPYPKAERHYMSLISMAGQAMRAVRSYNSYVRTPASRSNTRSEAVYEEFAERDVLYLAGLIAKEDIRESVKLYGALKGTFPLSESSMVDDASVGQVTEAVEVAKRLFSDMSVRKVPALIVPAKAKDRAPMDRIISSYTMNIGYGFGVTVGSSTYMLEEPEPIFETVEMPSALEAMHMSILFMRRKVVAVGSRTSIISNAAAALEAGNKVAFLENISKRMLAKLSQSNITFMVTPEFMSFAHSLKTPGILRRRDYNTASASERKLKLFDATGIVVPYLALRRRSTLGSTYSHRIDVFTHREATDWERGIARGSIDGDVFTIGDMKVYMRKATSTAYLEVSYFPPAVCITMDDGEEDYTIPLIDCSFGMDGDTDITSEMGGPEMMFNPDMASVAESVLEVFCGDREFHAMISTRAVSNSISDSVRAFIEEILRLRDRIVITDDQVAGMVASLDEVVAADMVESFICHCIASKVVVPKSANRTFYTAGIQGVVDGISIKNFLRSKLVLTDSERPIVSTAIYVEAETPRSDDRYTDLTPDQIAWKNAAMAEEDSEEESEDELEVEVAIVQVDRGNLGLEEPPNFFTLSYVEDKPGTEKEIEPAAKLATTSMDADIEEWEESGGGYKNAPAMAALNRFISRSARKSLREKVLLGNAYGPVVSYELASTMSGARDVSNSTSKIIVDLTFIASKSPEVLTYIRSRSIKEFIGKVMYYKKSLFGFTAYSPVDAAEAKSRYKGSSASSTNAEEMRKAYNTASGTFFG